MKRFSIALSALLCAHCMSADGAIFHDFLFGPGGTAIDNINNPTIPFNQPEYDFIIGYTGTDPNDRTVFTNPLQVTVNLGVAGTAPNQTFGQLPSIVNIYNGSTLNLLANANQAEADEVILFDSSQLVENAGRVGVTTGKLAIDSRGTSQVHLKGGLVLGDVAPGEDSKVLLEGPATINGKVIEIARSALVASSGIIKQDVTLASQSTAAFSGDVELDGSLIVDATGGGSATIDGGKLGDVIDLAGKVTMNGGTAGNLLASRSNTDPTKNGVFTVSGGTVQGVSVILGGSFSMQGGTLVHSLIAQNDGTIAGLGPVTVGGVVEAYDNATIEINGTQIGDAVTSVGGAVINMQDGSIPTGVTANGGQFNMHGGSVGGVQVFAADNGDYGFTMDGGEVFHVGVEKTVGINNSGRVHIKGGHIQESISDFNGFVQMDGGISDGVFDLSNASMARVTGGSVGGISAIQTSSAQFSNAVVNGDVTTNDNSHLSFTGTNTINGAVDAFDMSRIDLGNTSVRGFVIQHGQSRITWSRKFPGVVIAQSAGKAIGGQSLLATGADNDPKPMEFFLLDESTLQFLGLDFQSTLIDGNAQGKYSEYGVTGHFANGEAFPTGLLVFVENGHGADPLGLPHFEFAFESVPEPGSAALIACAAMILGCRRVKKANARRQC